MEFPFSNPKTHVPILVSIIVPCFNQGQYLAQALLSIWKQINENWECIIVNDGSSDETEEIARDWTRKDTRFNYVSQTNSGLASARNLGLTRAKGKYILFLDSDDIIYPEYIAHVKQKISKSNVQVLICGYTFLNHDLTNVISVYQPTINTKSFLKHILSSSIAPVHAYVTRKDLLHQIGEFDTSLRSCEDWDLWIRAAKVTANVVSLAYIGAGYRMTPGSMSRNSFTFLDANIKVAMRATSKDERLPPNQKVLKEPVEPAIIRWLLTSCGSLIFNGQLLEAKKMFEQTANTYQLIFSAQDFTYLFSYFTYNEKPDYNYRLRFWANNLLPLSEFLLFCESVLKREHIYDTALMVLMASQLNPKGIHSMIPFMNFRELLSGALRRVPRALKTKLFCI
ncbi:MAG: glycosyltransferase [Segetibacter sp.]